VRFDQTVGDYDQQGRGGRTKGEKEEKRGEEGEVGRKPHIPVRRTASRSMRLSHNGGEEKRKKREKEKEATPGRHSRPVAVTTINMT